MSGKTKQTRVRIAPSPTGYPHIGTIYQALFNYAFAKKHNGSFVVRIEDTDQARLVEDAEQKIYQALDWFGLTEDESPRKDGDFAPYRQSERLGIYHKHAQDLVNNGSAYFSDPSAQETKQPDNRKKPENVKQMLEWNKKLAEKNEQGWTIRLTVPEKNITVKDEIRGDIDFDHKQVTSQVLLKSDGFPTYHLAVVVDDHKMQISDAVRGEEWISSFPKHYLIYKGLGWEMPRFYHTPVLRNPDKSKLSKRHGHTNVAWYQEQGFLKEAILNFLALLGWSHPEEKEIFSMEEFTRLMDLKDIKPVAPIFDLKKLEWMNGEYIRAIENKKLQKRIASFDKRFEQIEESTLLGLIEIGKTRIKTLKDFSHMFEKFLWPEKKDENDIQKTLYTVLENTQDWKQEDIFKAIKQMLDEKNLRFPDIYKAIIGEKFGPPLADTFEVLGKEKTLEFLK